VASRLPALLISLGGATGFESHPLDSRGDSRRHGRVSLSIISSGVYSCVHGGIDDTGAIDNLDSILLAIA
jgi:hypothetical protein